MQVATFTWLASGFSPVHCAICSGHGAGHGHAALPHPQPVSDVTGYTRRGYLIKMIVFFPRTDVNDVVQRARLRTAQKRRATI